MLVASWSWLDKSIYIIIYTYTVEYRNAMKCPSFDDLFTTGVALNKRRL